MLSIIECFVTIVENLSINMIQRITIILNVITVKGESGFHRISLDSLLIGETSNGEEMG